MNSVNKTGEAPTPVARRCISVLQVFVATALTTWIALRIVLWAHAGITKLSPGEFATAMFVGLWLDVATLGYLVSPMLLVAALLPNRFLGSRAGVAARYGAMMLLSFWLLFEAVAEYVFWEEFTTRFNFIAVDYLIYTTEVIDNIRQSYPVPLILSAIGALAALLTWVAFRRVKFSQTALTAKQRMAMAVAAVALPVASYGLANIEQMNGAGNEIARELSGNGIFNLAAAMRRNELDYDTFYLTIGQEEADAILVAQGVERAPLSGMAGRKFDAHEPEELGPFSRSPRNIVLITVESLSAQFLGAYGSIKHLTPRLDELAAQGLRFERVYATGTRTVRGLEALSLGTPPIPGQSILRRPNNRHLMSIGQFLAQQGFAPFFFYGGYGYFDNMNAFFEGNDYKVIDRLDIPAASIVFENAWGVADETLFSNALQTLDQADGRSQRFFAHFMTTSNHRPFTYPDGRVETPSPGGREGAVRYTDFAIGQFIEQAKSHSWFKDTLFVIVADHCAAVAGNTKLPMTGYRIPLIFFAPDMLKPGIFAPVISQLDIPPTLLDLLRADGDDYYFGESIFENMNKPGRAMISNYQELGYYKNDLLTVLLPRKQVQAFHIDPVSLAATPAVIDPVLLNEAIAYYQTASRAFKSNALRIPESTNPVQ